MKKNLKIGICALALALLAGLVYLVNLFTGYPVSYFLVQNAANRHLAKTYPYTDFVAKKPEYSLKRGGFLVQGTSPTSQDSHFSLTYDLGAHLQNDTYEKQVTSGLNTALRLSQEYSQLAKLVLSNALFPFDVSGNASFESAISGDSQLLEEPGTPPDQWDFGLLIPDQEYKLADLAARYGILYLDVTAEEVSAQTAAAALLKAKEVLEMTDVPFFCAEIWVHTPQQSDGGTRAKELHLMNFAWDDIYEDGMVDRVQAALEETAAYYGRRICAFTCPNHRTTLKSGISSEMPLQPVEKGHRKVAFFIYGLV